MYKSQSIDRGIRIMGGCVLIFLAFTAGGVDSIGKIVAIAVGLYGLITGTINFCPFCYAILREKTQKRRKSTLDEETGMDDVKSLYFFEGLSDNEIDTVLSQCQLKQYPEDYSVIVEGKHKKILFIVFSGKFKIVKLIANKETKIIGTVNDGETFGELSFFDNLPPSASVVSMQPSKVLEINEIGFSELIGKDPYLGLKVLSRLMRITSSRVRTLDEQISSIGNLVVQRRQKNKLA